MTKETKEDTKLRLHAKNKNREDYDLKSLVRAKPELSKYLKPNKFGVESIDFADPIAVKVLNKAILSHYYGIRYWDFPQDNLCPPIPGRADYIHYMADLLTESNLGTLPKGEKITCLDIGVGANCIYPIIGLTEYKWRFIGSDIDTKSLISAQNIIDSNASLKGKIECRLQDNSKEFFEGIIRKGEKIDISFCNPPFHSSAEEAMKGSQRKIKNLTGTEQKTPTLNFAGISKELIYEGGEFVFISNLIRESKSFAHSCFWFSSLVSKQSNLVGINKALEYYGAKEVKVIPMGTGNKTSRIVAWTFLTPDDQKYWRENSWK